MSAVEKAIEWALEIARNAAHGYDQSRRWGPDYDCSSLVISAWEAAGVPVKTQGATYTGNMRGVFLRCGFGEVSDGSLEPGDVLLNVLHHTAMYIGNGQLVQASINEKGSVTGGVSGDQSGREIAVRSYYDYPWDCVLRYQGGTDETENDCPSQGAAKLTGSLPVLRKGDRGGAVLSMQLLLIHKWVISCGADGADGDFGPNTETALKRFQNTRRLAPDGVCGELTWAELMKGERQ